MMPCRFSLNLPFFGLGPSSAMSSIYGSHPTKLVYFSGPWTLDPHLKWPLLQIRRDTFLKLSTLLGAVCCRNSLVLCYSFDAASNALGQFGNCWAQGYTDYIWYRLFVQIAGQRVHQQIRQMCSSNSYRVQAACALGLVAELFTLGVLEPPSSPPIFFQAFSLRHHPTLFVREIETNNLLAVKHSIPRRSFILSCCLQVQSRRKGVVSSGRSGLAVLS